MFKLGTSLRWTIPCPSSAHPLLYFSFHQIYFYHFGQKKRKEIKSPSNKLSNHQGVRKSQILRSAFVFTFLWFLENHIKDHPPSLYKYYIHHALNFVNLHCFYHGARNLFFFIHILILILIQPNMELRCLCQFLWQRYPP